MLAPSGGGLILYQAYGNLYVMTDTSHLGLVSFTQDYEDASINLNVDGGDDEEDEVQEVERLMGREKAKVLKKKGQGASGSSATTMTKHWLG
ncbi:hypothetical protein Tco_0290090 [Tanacetum coccineum]